MPRDLSNARFVLQPSAQEQLARMEPEVREELMLAIKKMERMLRRNPWLGTPEFGGAPMRVYVWCRRWMRHTSNWVSDRFTRQEDNDGLPAKEDAV